LPDTVSNVTDEQMQRLNHVEHTLSRMGTKAPVTAYERRKLARIEGELDAITEQRAKEARREEQWQQMCAAQREGVREEKRRLWVEYRWRMIAAIRRNADELCAAHEREIERLVEGSPGQVP